MRNQQERERLLNGFADPDGSDTTILSLNRNQGDQATFSEAAITQIKDDLYLFVGGRICAFHIRTGKPAQKLKITVSVEVDTFVD